MIENKLQLKVSNKQLKNLQSALLFSVVTTVEMPSEIYKAMIKGLESLIKELEAEIKRYKISLRDKTKNEK